MWVVLGCGEFGLIYMGIEWLIGGNFELKKKFFLYLTL